MNFSPQKLSENFILNKLKLIKEGSLNLANHDDEKFVFGGLTFYGGLIFGSISVIIYAKKYNISIKHLVDVFAPALIIAYGIGRIGCQMAGDGCWGVRNDAQKPDWMSFLPDWMWSTNFPHNINQDGQLISNCTDTFWQPYCWELPYNVWPTAFYETTMALLIFAILWGLRKKINIPGILFCIYLIFNGLERFYIENFRDHTGLEKYDLLGGLYQAQIISSCLILIGFSGSLYLYIKHKENKV